MARQNLNLAIKKEEVAVVHQIYERYINDGYGAARISIFPNERILQTKQNCNQPKWCLPHFAPKTLYQKNHQRQARSSQLFDWTAGEQRYFGMNGDEGQQNLRIIDLETFERAHQIMQSHDNSFKVDKERQSNKYLSSTQSSVMSATNHSDAPSAPTRTPKSAESAPVTTGGGR